MEYVKVVVVLDLVNTSNLGRIIIISSTVGGGLLMIIAVVTAWYVYRK